MAELAASVIICTRNRAEMLAETIDSILAGTMVPAELIVVDQSRSPNEAWAHRPLVGASELRYLWTQSVGLSRARNIGLAAAQHDLVVFTDDDVFATEGWLERLVHALCEAGPRTVVTGQVRPSEERPGYFTPSTKRDDLPAVYEGRVPIAMGGVLLGVNMGMYRSAIEEVGLFDEELGAGASFPSSEDNDLGFRLLEAGYRIIYVPEALLYHRAWRSNRELIPLWWGYGVGQGAFYAKHLSLRDPYILKCLCWDVMRHVRRLPRRLWQRNRPGAVKDVMYTFGILYGATRWRLTWRKTP